MLGALALPAPAWAADDPIVVTARRRDERPDVVPLAVDVVRADDIGAGGVAGLPSLAARVPGLSFESGPGGNFATPALRGQNQPNPRIIDAVGMFIDGVYQANRNAVDAEPLDLERIEVVHGPQSALFGHSSFSGLIHLIPAEPTESLYVSAAADIGSDNLRGLRGTLSGPLGTLFKVRIAASWKSSDGTYENAALPGRHLGNAERFAVAASLATRDDSGPFSARLSARFSNGQSNNAARATLDYRDYNCGGRDPASGFWSYFCGPAPLPEQISVSPDIPDSYSRGGQVALRLALEKGGVELRSDTSFYKAETGSYNDFDGTAEGEVYGVCIVAVSCSGIGSFTIPVVRLQRVNMVLKRAVAAREFAQELRIRGNGDNRFDWQIGATVFRTRVRTILALGGARGELAAGERFSSLVLANPLRVGAPAAVNFALVDDPNRSQIVQSDVVDARRTIAVFATADYRLTERVRFRGEARVTWERLVVDGRRANFAASFGKSFGARYFHDITPRFSLDWRPNDGWLAFVSYARGSRSGGINTVPNLLTAEQTYEPESNWTAEAGVKYSDTGLVRSARLVAYDIDWRNSQILGFSTSPGVNALIIRNTRGIHTQGFELGAELAPARWLQVDFAHSYTRPRFKPGSEDPGSSSYCGLAPGVTFSSFCTIRASLINPGQLVPDISGKRPNRAVKTTWTAGVTVSPPVPALPGLRLHASISHQGNVFADPINGLYSGARTLLGARMSFTFGTCSIELWGTNLGDARYVSFTSPRGPAFYNGIPRPTDLFLGEGRRMGLTLRFAS